MERVNIQFEENTLKKIRLVATVENKSVAAVLREAAHAYLSTKSDLKEKIDDVLRASDAEFDAALEESFTEFDYTYKKLAE